jgi:hypothetical protein
MVVLSCDFLILFFLVIALWLSCLVAVLACDRKDKVPVSKITQLNLPTQADLLLLLLLLKTLLRYTPSFTNPTSANRENLVPIGGEGSRTTQRR